jgi:hypothetical protein
MATTAEGYVREVVANLVAQINDAMDPAQAAIMAQSVVEAWEGHRGVLSDVRREAFRRAEATKRWNRTELAALCGLTRQRVATIIDQRKGTVGRAYGPALKDKYYAHESDNDGRAREVQSLRTTDLPVRADRSRRAADQ